jgi:hypothetical protein
MTGTFLLVKNRFIIKGHKPVINQYLTSIKVPAIYRLSAGSLQPALNRYLTSIKVLVIYRLNTGLLQPVSNQYLAGI